MYPAKVPKLDTNMAEKTPVSLLQELSIRELGQSPFSEYIPHESDPKLFSCITEAFNHSAIGSGRSKKEAKHEASAKLIAQLRLDDAFRDKLPVVPQTPRPSSEVDAVSQLLDICVQRNYPIATFKVMQASGEPHRPQFTVICQMSSIKRTGKFTTKKGAKQIAALAMLKVVQSFPNVEERQQVARVDVDPPERLFRTYCELKKSDIKHVPIRLRDRHRYLLKLPIDDRQKAYEILMKNRINTARDKIDLACKALKLEYDIKDVPEQPNLKMFVLLGDYDCVLIEESDALCVRVIDYFENMLNFKIIS